MICGIDSREKDRGKRALTYFTNAGFQSMISELTVGDYGFYDNGINVLFEYKTIADFISSIEDNRVFNQALNQSNTSDYHFVLVVGSDKDFTKAVDNYGYHTKHYIGKETWNGSIASLVNFTSVLTAKNEEWSFDLMKRVAVKCCNTKPVVHRFPKSRGSPAYRLLVNNVNRIGTKTAENICKTLKLETIDDVLSLSVADLVKVDGVADVKAKSILKQVKSAFE